MIDDLLPRVSRAHKRPSSQPRATEPAAGPAHTPPAPANGSAPAPGNGSGPARGDAPKEPRPSGRRRELAFGVTLALLAAVAITWWATSAREPKPSFVGSSLPTVADTPLTNVSGGPAAPAGPRPGVEDTAPTTPSSAAAAGRATTRATLTTTYDAMHSVYHASRSYQTISYQTLGQLLPGITIEDGAASSTNSRVVSLLTPAPDRVVLAVRDDAGCAWLRDYGRGAQTVTHATLVITCSAAAAPTTGWTST